MKFIVVKTVMNDYVVVVNKQWLSKSKELEDAQFYCYFSQNMTKKRPKTINKALLTSVIPGDMKDCWLTVEKRDNTSYSKYLFFPNCLNNTFY